MVVGAGDDDDDKTEAAADVTGMDSLDVGGTSGGLTWSAGMGNEVADTP